MNYYPYYNFPYGSLAQVPKASGLKSLFGGIKWSSILSGTQKTLNVVNQAIPIIKQAGPVINNAKTMFRVMNEFKKVDIPENNTIESVDIKKNSDIKDNNVIENNKLENNGPIFFQ